MANDFSQNPFQGLSDLLGGGMPQGGGAPAPAPQGAVGPMTAGGKPAPVATDHGANPGITRFATQALNAMQSMISESTDPQEITKIRLIVSLINKLIEEDQKKQITGPAGQTPASAGAQASAQGGSDQMAALMAQLGGGQGQ